MEIKEKKLLAENRLDRGMGTQPLVLKGREVIFLVRKTEVLSLKKGQISFQIHDCTGMRTISGWFFTKLSISLVRCLGASLFPADVW